jgi:nucleoside-diphosphate-sugar epimerase
VVFHVAGAVAARSAGDFMRTNRDGAARIARAAARAGVARFVLVSSLAATGPSQPQATVDERTPPRPVTEYGRSKLAGEQAVRETGVPLTVVRPPAVYGPRDRAFLTAFRAAARGLLPLPGDGRRRITLVHVRDLAQALIAAASCDRTLGRTYHAGNPEPVTQQELAAGIGRALGRPVRTLTLPGRIVRPLLTLSGVLARLAGGVPLLDGDKANELLAPGWVCSSEALRVDAGWRPAIPLAAGLVETAASYRELGWL